jgi:hypothetical protein
MNIAPPGHVWQTVPGEIKRALSFRIGPAADKKRLEKKIYGSSKEN